MTEPRYAYTKLGRRVMVDSWEIRCNVCGWMIVSSLGGTQIYSREHFKDEHPDIKRRGRGLTTKRRIE